MEHTKLSVRVALPLLVKRLFCRHCVDRHRYDDENDANDSDNSEHLLSAAPLILTAVLCPDALVQKWGIEK